MLGNASPNLSADAFLGIASTASGRNFGATMAAPSVASVRRRGGRQCVTKPAAEPRRSVG